MTNRAGDRLPLVLPALADRAGWTIDASTHGTARHWHLAGTDWQAEVIVDPPRWIGVTFVARDPATGRTADHAIDTDLYSFAKDADQGPAIATEDEIVALFEALADGAVLRGTDGSTFVVIVPLGDRHVRIAAGRFATTATGREGPATTEGFVPLR